MQLRVSIGIVAPLVLVGLFLVALPAEAGAVTEPTSTVAPTIEVDVPGGDAAAEWLENEYELAELQRSGAPDLLDARLQSDVLPSSAARSAEGESPRETNGSGASSDPPESFAFSASYAPSPPPGLRVLAETGGALVAGLGGALIGAFVVGSLGAVVGVALLAADPLLAVAGLAIIALAAGIGAGIGALSTLPAGVWAGGRMTGGEGHILWTYAGGLVGVLAGLGVTQIAILNLRPGPTRNWIAGTSLGVLPLAGSILAYELSHGASRRRADADGAAPPEIRPTVSPVASQAPDGGVSGATAGVHVRF